MERHRIERSARAIVAAATTLAVLAVPGRAVAHAIVEATQPRIDQVVERSPTAVTMEFNEPVEIAFGAIRVYDTRPRSMPARPGTWPDGPTRSPCRSSRISPRDLHGHLAGGLRGRTSDRGGLRLSRPATRAESPGHRRGHPVRRSGCRSLEGALAGLGRWLTFSSLLVLAGAAGFLVLVWRRAGATGRPNAVEDRFGRRWLRVVVWTWTLAVVSTVLLYVVHGAIAADLPLSEAVTGDVLAAVAGTRFGVVSLARLGLLMVAAGIWLALRPSLARAEGRSLGAARAAAALPGGRWWPAGSSWWRCWPRPAWPGTPAPPRRS